MGYDSGTMSHNYAKPDKTPADAYALSFEQVRFSIAPDSIPSPAEAPAQFDIIGQPRAIQALRMAIEMPAKGYNVFVTGPAGTGKRTAIIKLLRERRPPEGALHDCAYVHNFRSPYEPRVLYFPPGKARAFRTAMQRLIEQISDGLQLVFEDKQYQRRREEILLASENAEQERISEFESRLDEAGFQIVRSAEDEEKPDLAPLLDGKPASFDELQRQAVNGTMDQSRLEQIRENYFRFIDEMSRIFAKLRVNRNEMRRKLVELQASSIEPQLREEIDRLKREFPGERIAAHLDAVREAVLSGIEAFAPEAGGAAAAASGSAGTGAAGEAEHSERSRFQRFDVNVVVEHTETEHSPVVFESTADYAKLFGTVEPSGDGGDDGAPGFMNLRAGSVLQASGGFLILRAQDILTQEEAWSALKRALQDGAAEIRTMPGPYSHPSGLKPEPIDLSVKVIIMGNEHIYDILYNQDEEFGKLFKMPAEFDAVMERSPRNTGEYVAFMRMIQRDEQLLPLEPDGIAAVIEHGVRLSEFRNRLSTRFSRVADLLREADYWGRRHNVEQITRREVQAALDQRRYLYNLPEEKIDEQILSHELLISVAGSAIGRINGLAVIDRGYYAFGRPMVITVRIAPGDDGIINIERESGLSGELHDKGVYIIEGYLQSKYLREHPLSIRASICFEQSYVEVDGDSASSSEIYVLLSAIAEVPLRQDIAVTGSGNQMGEVQAVGGISEKIEGFYEVCRKLGISGTQGVIIPRGNIENLILSHEVQEEIRCKRFHIWAVDTIDQGIEILTGLPAGVRTQRDQFQSGTVNSFVERRLREMAEQMQRFRSR